MKTTLELPDELMRALKIRAANEGRRLKDVVATVISDGLAHPAAPAGPSRVQFPLVSCNHEASPGTEMTPRVAEILALEEAAGTGGAA